MKNWDDLNMKNKAKLIKLAVKSGITDLNVIKERYNQFKSGGVLSKEEVNEVRSNLVSPIDMAFNILRNNKPYTKVTKIKEPVPVDDNYTKLKQAWAESAGNNSAVSQAGAMGKYQIMPKTHDAYVKATGKKGDLTDPVYNEIVRDWVWNDIQKSNTINAGNPTDSVRYAKTLAAYNFGLGNTGKKLQELKNKDIDIYTSLDFINYFPKETRDYVNFILREQDTGSHRNMKAFNKYMENEKIIPNSFGSFK